MSTMADRKAPGAPAQAGPASETWHGLPWRKLERHVFRIQKRIYQASQRGNQRAVQKLQKLLMKSQAARLLALRRVRQQEPGNAAPNTGPGQRAQMRPQHRRTRPPTPRAMDDRAQQALVQLALAPAWEARREPGSYSSGSQRSRNDALMAIRREIRIGDRYVLTADLQGCVAIVNRQALVQKLQTTPAIRRAVRAWLTAGMVDEAVASLLTDVALHGLETSLVQACAPQDGGVRVVRCGGACVVLHTTLAGARKARAAAQAWLQTVGLALDASKTQIAHTLRPYQGRVGFDFLGWTVRQRPVGGKRAGGRRAPGIATIIRPGREGIQRHMAQVKRMIGELMAASQETLIERLNSIIGAWVASSAPSARDLAACDHQLEWLLWRWARRRHPNKGQGWIRERYWRTDQGRHRVFGTGNGTALCLHAHARNWPHVQGALPAMDICTASALPRSCERDWCQSHMTIH